MFGRYQFRPPFLTAAMPTEPLGEEASGITVGFSYSKDYPYN
jgi:hypothetical protein